MWSIPETRKKVLEGLAEKGFGHEQLAEMQRIINAEKSDLFDVLAYVAYALPPLTREERAARAKVAFTGHFTNKQQAFLEFVLAHYVGVGVGELDPEKITRYSARVITTPLRMRSPTSDGRKTSIACSSASRSICITLTQAGQSESNPHRFIRMGGGENVWNEKSGDRVGLTYTQPQQKFFRKRREHACFCNFTKGIFKRSQPPAQIPPL